MCYEQGTGPLAEPNEEEESRAKRRINKPRYLEDYVGQQLSSKAHKCQIPLELQ